MLTAWGKQLPEGAVVKPSPAVWNEPMRMHAKAYFIAEVLDVKETMHPVIFDAMHVQRKRLTSRLELRDLFEDNGVDPEKFDKAFDSFGVDSQVRQADARARAQPEYQALPSLMVAGKYLIETRAAGSQTNMLDIARFLVEKELAARQSVIWHRHRGARDNATQLEAGVHASDARNARELTQQKLLVVRHVFDHGFEQSALCPVTTQQSTTSGKP